MDTKNRIGEEPDLENLDPEIAEYVRGLKENYDAALDELHAKDINQSQLLRANMDLDMELEGVKSDIDQREQKIHEQLVEIEQLTVQIHFQNHNYQDLLLKYNLMKGKVAKLEADINELDYYRVRYQYCLRLAEAHEDPALNHPTGRLSKELGDKIENLNLQLTTIKKRLTEVETELETVKGKYEKAKKTNKDLGGAYERAIDLKKAYEADINNYLENIQRLGGKLDVRNGIIAATGTVSISLAVAMAIIMVYSDTPEIRIIEKPGKTRYLTEIVENPVLDKKKALAYEIKTVIEIVGDMAIFQNPAFKAKKERLLELMETIKSGKSTDREEAEALRIKKEFEEHYPLHFAELTAEKY